MNPIMNIRTFLKGGYRELTGPTTIISGQTAIFTAAPIDAAPGPAHPDPEGALRADREGHAGGATPQGARLPVGERTEAPHRGGSVSSTASEPSAAGADRGVPGTGPAKPARRKSIQATLDAANKAGRG